MRRIEKGPKPEALIRWEREEVDFNRHWPFPSDVGRDVKASLLISQGHLCAYTEISITMDESPMEHLKPQHQCERGSEDIDYRNLVAAYPKDRYCPFGAQCKGGWYEERFFISPLREDVEQRFAYGLNGKVSGAIQDDDAASETINRLNLNHRDLIAGRLQAIDDLVSLSDRKLSEVAEKAGHFQAGGKLMAYPSTLVQASRELLRRRQKAKDRQRFRRQR